ncbi:MAG: hypothetical protein ILM98_14215 [Kiritimatiellae bacterium]|nr:hypothetical protein [Kiritimatiellia bacterium]
MNKMLTRKLISLAMLLATGCATTGSDPEGPKTGKGIDTDDSVKPPITAVSVSNSMLGERRVEDSRIRITYRDSGLENVTIADDADIRDIQAFAITAYRKVLKNKLQNGDPITKGETELLGFICFVQHVALASFTEYGYLHLTGRVRCDKKESPILKDIKVNGDHQLPREAELLRRSVVNFNSNSNVLARLIDCWSGESLRDDANQIFSEIVAPQYGRKKDAALVAKPEEFFLATNPILLWSYVQYTDDLNALKNKDGEYTGQEYTGIFDPPKTSKLNNKQKALLWGRVANSLRFYSGDCGELHRDMARSIQMTSDSYTKRQIEDLRIKYAQWLEDDFYKFREVYYAYPFICECKKLFERIQDARHTLFKSNKEQMEDAAMMFCEATSVNGNEMIKNLNSRYAAKVYGDTIRELKRRAGSRKFKEIQEKCRLWSLDEPEFDISDDEFGIRKVKYMKKD